MKNLIRITVACALALSLACCQKTGSEPEQKAGGEQAKRAEPAAKNVIPTKKVGLETGGKTLGGGKVKLNAVKMQGKGYDGEYNEALDSWKFEKWVPNAEGGNDNVVRIYLDAFDDRTTNMDRFAKKLQEKDFLDFGSVWTKVDKKESLDIGWVITGDNYDGEDTEKVFAVRINAINALCRGYIKHDAPGDHDKLRQEGIAACQTAKITQ